MGRGVDEEAEWCGKLLNVASCEEHTGAAKKDGVAHQKAAVGSAAKVCGARIDTRGGATHTTGDCASRQPEQLECFEGRCSHFSGRLITKWMIARSRPKIVVN